MGCPAYWDLGLTYFPIKMSLCSYEKPAGPLADISASRTKISCMNGLSRGGMNNFEMRVCSERKKILISLSGLARLPGPYEQAPFTPVCFSRERSHTIFIIRNIVMGNVMHVYLNMESNSQCCALPRSCIY